MSSTHQELYPKAWPVTELKLDFNPFIVAALVFVAFLVFLYMLWVSCASDRLTHRTTNGDRRATSRQFVVTECVPPSLVAVEATPGMEDTERLLSDYDSAREASCESLWSKSRHPKSRRHSKDPSPSTLYTEVPQSVPPLLAPDYDFSSRTNLLTINMDLPAPVDYS